MHSSENQPSPGSSLGSAAASEPSPADRGTKFRGQSLAGLTGAVDENIQNSLAGSSTPKMLQHQAFQPYSYALNEAPENDEGDKMVVPSEILPTETIQKYMRVIGMYKELQLGSEFEMPRLVLAGEQSCGKSSLLENLTQLPVPITIGIGTRFPIEVSLIEDHETIYQIRLTIILNAKEQVNHMQRKDREEVEDFNRNNVYSKPLTEDTFKRLLRKASIILRVKPPIFAGDDISNISQDISPRDISTHCLQIEMRGPEYKTLSFVDTPGLYRADSKNQDIASAGEIRNLVKDLITEKRTIIVGVMDSTQSVELQEIFNLATGADKERKRTLGVLTKCDRLRRPDSIKLYDDARLTFKVAANETHPLDYGWYLVINRDSEHARDEVTLEDARQNEEEIFSKIFSVASSNSGYTHVDKERVGIGALRTGLSAIYCGHLQAEFPKLNKQIVDKLAKAEARLRALGPERGNYDDQLDYLKRMVAKYEIQKAVCLKGSSGGDVDVYRLAQRLSDCKKTVFRDELKESGTTWEFEDPESGEDNHGWTNKSTETQENPEDIYDWISDHYSRTQTDGIPGLISQDLLETLFAELTKTWKDVTEGFVERVTEIFQEVLDQCLQTACENRSVKNSVREVLKRKLEEKMANLLNSCFVQIKHQQEGLQVVAYEDKFLEMVQEARTTRILKALDQMRFCSYLSEESPESQASLGSLGVITDAPSPMKPKLTSTQKALQQDRRIDFSSLHDFMRVNRSQLSEVLNHKRQVVYEIHDKLKAYHAIALPQYTDTVCKCVLSKESIQQTMDICSYDLFKNMDRKDIEDIAGETAADQRTRQELEDTIQRLGRALTRSKAIMKDPSIMDTWLSEEGHEVHDQSTSSPPRSVLNTVRNFMPGMF